MGILDDIVKKIHDSYKYVFYSSKRDEITIIKNFERWVDEGGKVMTYRWQYQNPISEKKFYEIYDVFLGVI